MQFTTGSASVSVDKEMRKINKSEPTAYNTVFVAHFVRPNASHFTNTETVSRNNLMEVGNL